MKDEQGNVLDADLHDVIGDECANDPNYCGQNYWVWEKEIAEPLLIKKGWEALNWFTEEGDSFGPLIRAVRCKSTNEVKTFYYG